MDNCRDININKSINQLGPFSSILINDLVNSSKMLSFLMYADDTTIYFNLEDFLFHNRHIFKLTDNSTKLIHGLKWINCH